MESKPLRKTLRLRNTGVVSLQEGDRRETIQIPKAFMNSTWQHMEWMYILLVCTCINIELIISIDIFLKYICFTSCVKIQHEPGRMSCLFSPPSPPSSPLNHYPFPVPNTGGNGEDCPATQRAATNISIFDIICMILKEALQILLRIAFLCYPLTSMAW